MQYTNQEALQLATKVVLSKTNQCKELQLKSTMEPEQIDELIEARARAKDETNWTQHVRGQRLYIEGLIKFIKSAKAGTALEIEYKHACVELADESQLQSIADEALATLE